MGAPGCGGTLGPSGKTALLGGVSPINPACLCILLGLLWGAREQFLPAAVTDGLVVVCGCLPLLCLTWSPGILGISRKLFEDSHFLLVREAYSVLFKE